GLVALADGRRVAARRDGARHLFDLPAGTRSVRLVSRHARPDWTGAGATDHRRLGVAVAGLRLDGREVPASDRGAGWQDAEPGWQWTDGDAAVIAGPGVLEVVLAPVGLEYWVRPQDAPHSVAGARPGAHPEAGRG
ncbi:MAG: hypothetical protein KGQ40_16375, partial [Rhodospirillales bacterium]|nr:hypothetical protein [Rhodospirillales bacterium]